MPFFTSILDPLINKSKFQIQQMVVALLIIPGMALIFNNTAMDMQAGVWVGILAAFLSSIYTVLSKKLVDNLPVKMLSFRPTCFRSHHHNLVAAIIQRIGLAGNICPNRE
jgi:drug/metabolite transporter (DMT)-like permease